MDFFITFLDISDRTGKIQALFRINILGDKYQILEYIDLGDWLGVIGKPFRTKTGQVTIQVENFQIFVAGVPFNLDEETIRQDFGECGKITDLIGYSKCNPYEIPTDAEIVINTGAGSTLEESRQILSEYITRSIIKK